MSRGRVWGAVHLARREEAGDFTALDAEALARIGTAVADGIRASLRFDAAREARDGTGPGLVVLGPTDEVEMITPPARALFATMASRPSAVDEPPSPVLALAAFARRQARRRQRATPTRSPCPRARAG